MTPARPLTIEERFWNFHIENPHVYKELRILVMRAKRKGHRKIGIKMLFEVLRWNRMMKTAGDEFKLNNDFTSRYARLLMESNKDLAGIFEVREIKTQ